MTETTTTESNHTPIVEDEQGLTALTASGDGRSLEVAMPIYSATGIKLLEVGAKVDSRVFEKLFGHQLAQPLDQCLTSEQLLRHADLIERTRALVAQQPLLGRFETQLTKPQRLWTAFAACPLPPSIALRLTMARDQAPALYEHSLRAAFVALFIGLSARFAENDLHVLASAALLHDIGMQHIDPIQFDEGRALSDPARRQLRAHPLAGQLIAQRDPALPSAVAAAIAQHHERLDGIGYPLGLKDEQIGRLARVLMLVEVVLAILERPSGKEQLQLSVTLRLNHRSFDRALSEIVLRALPRADESADAPRHSHEELDRAIALMVAWSDLRSKRDGNKTTPAFEFIDAQVARLRRWMAETGFDLANPGQADTTGLNEPQMTAEIHALGNEALWQARQIARDAHLRWPQPRSQGAAEVEDILQSAVTEWIAEALRANVLAVAV